MKILEKINFRQPKYMLPAILYFPLLGTSYFIFDLFQTETIEIQDKALQTTEFLNPELPGAQINDDGIGSKYENMAKSWGKIQDYSAVDNIDREEPDKNKEIKSIYLVMQSLPWVRATSRNSPSLRAEGAYKSFIFQVF